MTEKINAKVMIENLAIDNLGKLLAGVNSIESIHPALIASNQQQFKASIERPKNDLHILSEYKCA